MFKYIFSAIIILFFAISCKKKTNTTSGTTIPTVYDSFNVHYWRYDSLKPSTPLENKTIAYIFIENLPSDTIFTEVRKFKTVVIGNSSVPVYMILSKYKNGEYEINPHFLYSKGILIQKTSLSEEYIGRTYYQSGATNLIERMTLQKI